MQANQQEVASTTLLLEGFSPPQLMSYEQLLLRSTPRPGVSSALANFQVCDITELCHSLCGSCSLSCLQVSGLRVCSKCVLVCAERFGECVKACMQSAVSPCLRPGPAQYVHAQQEHLAGIEGLGSSTQEKRKEAKAFCGMFSSSALIRYVSGKLTGPGMT